MEHMVFLHLIQYILTRQTLDSCGPLPSFLFPTKIQTASKQDRTGPEGFKNSEPWNETPLQETHEADKVGPKGKSITHVFEIKWKR